MSTAIWWEDLRAAALVGTARRDVPDPVPGGLPTPAGPREQRMWESAALGDAVRRAGRTPVQAPAGTVVDAAPPEILDAAPAAATQVLGLLLTQPPVSAAERVELVRHWAGCAATAGKRVPADLLPPLLDLASSQPTLRAVVLPVLGEVGTWLGRQNPTWAWATDSVPPGVEGGVEDESEEWELLPADQRVAVLAQRRHADARAGLGLVRSTWDTEPAKHRAAYVGVLGAELSPADADFLEACLDDRAKGVRDEAARLLDRLPTSARALRMADRLRSLLTVTGTLRKTLVVDLPDDPDPAAVRDGLGDPGAGRSKRVHWLTRIVAGAPLEVWTAETGQPPAKVLRMLDESSRGAVLPALRETARQRRDEQWARALLAETWDISLAVVLPSRELEAAVLERVGHRPAPEMIRDLMAVPRPFGPDLSRAVVSVWQRSKEPASLAPGLRSAAGGALDPVVMPDLEAWLRRLGPDADKTLRTTLRDLLQEHSLRTSISEAFR